MPVLVSSPRFIGRREELGVLEAALARAESGEGSLVLVSGESGMGKSRLIGELAAAARARGAIVLIGECLELAEGELPYAPIVGALRSLLREPMSQPAQALPSPDDGQLVQLLAELTQGSAPSPDAAHSASAQARLFERLLATLSGLGRQAPAVVVVEDLHWADRSTGDFISFLVRNARRERLVLIVTYRSDELHRHHPLRPLVLELERSGRAARVELKPFNRSEIIDQLTAILGASPDATLIERLMERSEGNPFFAEELLAASVVPGSPLPESVRDVLLLRVEECSPAAQSALRIAAVAGRTVDHALLAAVAEMPEDELTAALREAVSRYVIVQDPSSSGYSFRHALLREAVYADLLPSQRRSLHLTLARALAAKPELSGTRAASAAELAYHWYAAHEFGEALSASISAGMEAEAVHAPAEAVIHYTRALEIWDRASADPPIDRLGVIRRAADATNLSGDPERAITLARSALDLVDEQADAVTAALVRERHGRYLWTAGREADALPEYRRAVELMPADPPSTERALVLAAEGQVLMLSGRTAESVSRCEEAIDIARRVGARAVEANALNTVGPNLTGAGDYERAVEATTRARQIARELGEVEEVARSFINGSDALDQAGHVEESIALALEGIEVARELGVDRVFGDFLRAEVAARLFRIARWAEAGQLLEELSQRSPTGLPMAMLHSIRGMLGAERGERDLAAREIERAAKLLSGMVGAMWLAPQRAAEATMELWSGRPEAAAAAVREALAQGDESTRVFFTGRLYDLGARAAADMAGQAPGDEHLRRRHQAAARALLGRIDAVLKELKSGAPPYALASRAACAAELSRIGGRGDPSAWADATRVWEEVGDRHQAAYARFRHAEAIVISEGDLRVAHALARDAHAVAVELEARPLRAQVGAFARRAGLDLGETEPKQAVAAVTDADGSGAEGRPLAEALAAALPSGVATVLFSDIENSTRLLDRLGDEPFMRLLHHHNRLVREQIARYDGREIKTAGDSFMVAFGQPRRALACAVAIQRAMSEVQPTIRVRIGLHAGETVQHGDDLFGRHVVIAARVAALAEGGEILVTSLVRELAAGGTGLRFGERREHTLKGLPGLHPVFPLQWREAESSLAQS